MKVFFLNFPNVQVRETAAPKTGDFSDKRMPRRLNVRNGLFQIKKLCRA